MKRLVLPSLEGGHTESGCRTVSVTTAGRGDASAALIRARDAVCNTSVVSGHTFQRPGVFRMHTSSFLTACGLFARKEGPLALCTGLLSLLCCDPDFSPPPALASLVPVAPLGLCRA